MKDINKAIEDCDKEIEALFKMWIGEIPYSLQLRGSLHDKKNNNGDE